MIQLCKYSLYTQFKLNKSYQHHLFSLSLTIKDSCYCRTIRAKNCFPVLRLPWKGISIAKVYTTSFKQRNTKQRYLTDYQKCFWWSIVKNTKTFVKKIWLNAEISLNMTYYVFRSHKKDTFEDLSERSDWTTHYWNLSICYHCRIVS